MGFCLKICLETLNMQDLFKEFIELKEIKIDEFTVGTTTFLYYKAERGIRSQVNVDFCSDTEILLRFNPSYAGQNRGLVLKSYNKADGAWEREERPPGFPIQPGMTDIYIYTYPGMTDIYSVFYFHFWCDLGEPSLFVYICCPSLCTP